MQINPFLRGCRYYLTEEAKFASGTGENEYQYTPATTTTEMLRLPVKDNTNIDLSGLTYEHTQIYGAGIQYPAPKHHPTAQKRNEITIECIYTPEIGNIISHFLQHPYSGKSYYLYIKLANTGQYHAYGLTLTRFTLTISKNNTFVECKLAFYIAHATYSNTEGPNPDAYVDTQFISTQSCEILHDNTKHPYTSHLELAFTRKINLFLSNGKCYPVCEGADINITQEQLHIHQDFIEIPTGQYQTRTISVHLPKDRIITILRAELIPTPQIQYTPTHTTAYQLEISENNNIIIQTL